MKQIPKMIHIGSKSDVPPTLWYLYFKHTLRIGIRIKETVDLQYLNRCHLLI